jgi:hypothetical protein
MAEEEAAIATTLPTTKAPTQGISAMATMASAPTIAILAAAAAVRHPRCWTHVTTSGLSTKPRLPPLATSAFAVAPASKCLTAMSRRKVVPPVSRIPFATARQRSKR